MTIRYLVKAKYFQDSVEFIIMAVGLRDALKKAKEKAARIFLTEWYNDKLSVHVKQV